MLKEILKRELKKPSRRRLLNLLDNIRAIGLGLNLSRLGKIYRSDKIGGHSYTVHYELHLKKFKYRRINLLEIGVGGYSDPNLGGNSLRMWKKYFPFGKIFSLDIYDKSSLQENRIKIFCGSQVDDNDLNRIVKEMGSIDIIIDDGSHINEHVIKTFNLLFPKLNDGGIYVIEDTQTSYWKEFGGDSDNLNNPKTIMNFFKNLTDSLNYKEFVKEDYEPTYFDKKIVSMHFYHNLIFIYKGNNVEESNIIVDNKNKDEVKKLNGN